MPYQYEYYDLFILIGDERDNVDETLTPDSLRNKLNLSKREFNSRMGVLMSYDLVDMVNNQHTLTTLGNDTYDSLRMIDNAIKMHKKFHTNNNNILNDISFLY